MPQNSEFDTSEGAARKQARKGKGAELVGVPVRRFVQYYPLTESDINQLSLLNTVVPLVLSFGAGILGFGLSRFADLLCIKVPEDQKTWAYAVPIAGCVIGGGLIVLAVILAVLKKSAKDVMLKTAKKETELGH